ncbi:helix-turn-helix domain-containing protein [Imhoffiella purpurea]|uniref:HTH cro/C1-type domain-containing protein n=1 Tax=Imhoffiella purpurea TaxID=1249627 RepID=W9V256_9GAMM|nr:helix-turn-helix transcriptional regulator [Imhoffiella purpurea]EXJ13578.1 hypothetical protein D779_3581 [Imhoffiella purpurea]
MTREIGRRLRFVRDRQQLSLGDLSKRTGGALGKSRISNYEQGTRRMGIQEAVILAQALGDISPSWLLCLGEEGAPLTDEEQRLIDAYRKTDTRGQRTLLMLAETLASELPA